MRPHPPWTYTRVHNEFASPNITSATCYRYYEPLRLPIRPAALSSPCTHPSMTSPSPHRVSSTGQSIFGNMPTLLPRESMAATSVAAAAIQRPCPFDQRVGFSISFTRLLLRSLALRPALLLFGNSRPRVAATPLPHATGVHGQLPGRDFNPQDSLLLLRTVRSCFFSQEPAHHPHLRRTGPA